MPPSRSDRSLLLLAGSAVAIAAVLVGGLILVITKSGANVPEGLIFVGYHKELEKNLRDEGPQYIPNTYGEDGFWLDIEDGDPIAVVLDRPGKKNCNVRWRDSKGGYSDCEGDIIQKDQLDRYAIVRGPKDAPKNALFANLKKVLPAPTAPTLAPN